MSPLPSRISINGHSPILIHSLIGVMHGHLLSVSGRCRPERLATKVVPHRSQDRQLRSKNTSTRTSSSPTTPTPMA
ncbi:hypothetical protein SCP_0900900 [Sparassis crispa]|uniref:Uncharacterized protein n=1 Tax=Sparassis crispa TaxID=139825 RepID=A0A401GVF1_9APHY|nr:hypothetical protein SCP_0900900 [Sparassis crispa]GBE86211.1 hypothetical protein SCP_0900900 [Sparassis crispa]